MQLGLRTKLTLVMTGLVFLVVVVLSAIFVARLTSQVIHDTNTRANELAQQMFEQAKHALEDAKEAGERPNSNSPEDRHAYVKRAFQTSDGLMAALQSPLGSNPWIYDVSIVDHDGRVLISSDQKMVGTTAQTRPPFAQIDRSNFIRQMKLLYGPQRVFDTSYAFTMAGAPFGEVRIGISIPLLRDANSSSLRTSGAIALVALLVSTGLAMVVSGATLAPLRDISAQLDRISAGQYDTPPAESKSFAVFAVAWRARNLQHHARKLEFGNGRVGGWPAAIHARRARGNGESRGGKIPRCPGWPVSGQAGNGNFPARPSAEAGVAS